MPNDLHEHASHFKTSIALYFTIPSSHYPTGQKGLIWCAGRQQLSFCSGTLHAVFNKAHVERAKDWLKTSDPRAKLYGELLSFPLSRRPVIHACSVCFCAAVCGKQDRGVERRPLFEADRQVNDIWASSLIQLSVVEMQARNSGPTGDGQLGKMRRVVSNRKGPLAFFCITLLWWNVSDGDCLKSWIRLKE